MSLWKREGCQTESKALEKSIVAWIVPPGFVKPIQNKLREIQNLIECRPSRAETGRRGERMELDSRKKSKRDRMIRSKSFEIQEVREIGRKEAGELIGIPISWMEIMEDVFQMEGKECRDQERLKM